jgi:hypothetical protein
MIRDAAEPFEFDTAPPKSSYPAPISLDFAAKASIAVCVDGLLLVVTPPGLRTPGSWRCKHRDGRGADLESEAMATKQTKQASKD